MSTVAQKLGHFWHKPLNVFRTPPRGDQSTRSRRLGRHATFSAPALALLSAVTALRADVGQEFLRALEREDLSRAKAIFLENQNEAAKAFERGLATGGAESVRRYRKTAARLQFVLNNRALGEIAGIDVSALRHIYRYKDRGLRDRKKENWQQAARSFSEALQVAGTYRLRWQQQHLSFLIAYTLADQRRFSEANHWLQQSLRFQDPKRLTHIDAMIEENLGNNAQKEGELYPALQHYHRSLELHSALAYPEGIAKAANNLATLYEESGNWKAALEYYRQCLRSLRPDHPDLPTVGNNVATCLLELNRAKEAAVILSKPLPRGSAAYFQRLNLRQQHLRLTDRSEQAAALAMLAFRQASQTGDPEFVSDALCDALRASAGSAEASRLIAEAAPLLPENDPNWWEIHLRLAQAYYREGKFAAVEGAARDAFAHLRQRRLGADFEFNFSARVLDVIRLWVSALVRQGKIYPGLVVWEMGKSFARGKPAPAVHAIQQTLGPACAIIDFCVAPEQTIVWVLRQNVVHGLLLNVSETALAGEINALLGPLTHTTNLLSPLYNQLVSSRLYRTLIAPLQGALRGADCWTILPDGKLHSIPFEILQDSRATPIVERATVRYWDMLSPGNGAARSLQHPTVWVDGPMDDSALLPAGTRVVTTWEQALESQGDMLHYAGHSILDETFPALSALTPGNRITARQISRAKLPYRLIVLSSCDSAGEVSGFGNGLLGLSAAFQSAGARQVIATLWPIDQRSSLLLGDFYRLPLQESALGENFRRARLKFRQRSFQVGSHPVSMSNPYFWAPYILIAPHYPHPRPQGIELLSFLIPLAVVTTRYCVRRRSEPKE